MSLSDELSEQLNERQRIAMGFWPRTLSGWWFWLRYWSPPAMWLDWWRNR